MLKTLVSSANTNLFRASKKCTLKVGRKATPLDIEIDPVGMDLTTDQGFANALFQVANLEPGSASMSAPVCSTFVFMSFGRAKCRFWFFMDVDAPSAALV